MSNDQQFRGFAMAVVEKVTGNDEYDETDWVDAIARAAYDLAQHTIGHTLEYLHECGISTSGGMGKRIAPSIPDMAVLPEENNTSTD